ncbi:MAG TPA: lysophospholipid acyltransferase family protein [Candidatus Binatia bacterium]|nr:lysophospholipid acyltransferase family protein [Candidatus Binatia bacterium]
MIYILKLAVVAVVTTILSLAILLLAPFDDREGRLAYRIGWLWSRMVLNVAGVRLKVHGLARLQRRAYIFIANHQSHIDIPVMVQSLPGFQLRWIAKKTLAYVPFFGWALLASRHILINRADRSAAMASLTKAKAKLAAGISVVIFPEGTRGVRGRLGSFKRGAFLLAMKTRTPIVPVTISGSWRIIGRKEWRLKSGEVEVIVHEPIDIERLGGKDSEELAERVRAIIESSCRVTKDPEEKLSGARAAAALNVA